ncbi:tryptophan-rich sensory protein TspO [Pontivivens insulae]|uniref:Tryptophan-rich sensory protein n=1 Tax=Pontivivens insulae TaxID=1639689 RepID=A0A2R8A9T6_9RHOB|nr:TspO/MBR family protein [Pontivivens insulae]RED12904.1 TspO/MBR related protein [Pontivivens insulae]SPF28996.1 Tryptophan-rich sensory protein [Pontivivens insulae]
MDILTFAIFFAACCAAASTGMLFEPGDWYDRLDKPAWNPPKWAFPVAWTILYIVIAIAAARVAYQGATQALAFWALQIALNTLWTPIFFGLKRLKAGLIAIICLWLAVLATTLAFFSVDELAGWLFVPYLLWVSYAAALNASLLQRNGDQPA